MKSSNVHSILSEVYRLLGDYTATDFAGASEYGGLTPPLRDALRALTIEASSGASRQRGSWFDTRQDLAVTRKAPSGRSDYIDELPEMILQARRLNSVQSILQFAKEVGLTVPARPKEGKDRLAKRVAEAIMLAREPRRSQIVDLLAGQEESQTQGWIDAIKNPRP